METLKLSDKKSYEYLKGFIKKTKINHRDIEIKYITIDGDSNEKFLKNRIRKDKIENIVNDG